MIRIRFVWPNILRFKRIGRLRQLRLIFVVIFWIKGKWPPKRENSND